METTQQSHAQVIVVDWRRTLVPRAREAWESLLARLPDAPPSWYPAWWEAVRTAAATGGWKVLIVSAFDRPIFLAPLEVRSPWLWKVPTLFADDYAPVLIDPEFAAQAWDGVAAWLAQQRGLRLVMLARGTDPHRLQLAMEACRAHGRPAVIEEKVPIFLAPLAETWEEYLATISANTRKNVRAAPRALQRDYPSTRLVYAESPQEIDSIVDAFVQLYNDRWLATDGHTIFDRPCRVAAFKAIMTHFWQRDIAFLNALEVEGRVIAAGTYLHIPGQATAYWHYTIRDPEALPPRFSPGIVVTADSIQRFIARGARRLNMGNGASPYKTDFGGVAATQWALSLATSPLALALAAKLDHLAHRLPGYPPGT